MDNTKPMAAPAMPSALEQRCLRLKTIFDYCVAERAPVESVWGEIEKWIDPMGSGGNATNPTLTTAGVEWTRPDLWDSTAPEGVEKLSASIQTSVTAPSLRWYRYSFSDKRMEDELEALAWLEAGGDTTWSALEDSDFNTEIGAAYVDFAGYGNAFLMLEEANKDRWAGLDFKALPLRECFFTERYDGLLDKFFRRFRYTPKQIVDKWGLEKVPEWVRTRAESASGDTDELTVVFAVYRRQDSEASPATDDKGEPALVAPEKRPVGCCYFLQERGDPLGEEGGYYEYPVYLARWRRTPGSKWGFGPGHLALPTARMVNALQAMDKHAIEKAIDPSILTTENNLLSDLDLKPGGVTVVARLDAIMVLESKARLDVSADRIAEAQAQLRRLFHIDELELKEAPAMTATEAQIRYELMNRLLGSTLTRLQSEVLGPILLAVWNILYRNKQIATTPDIVRKRKSQMGLEYQGPLARSQRTDEVAAIERLASFVVAIADAEAKASGTRAWDVFDPVQAIREAGKRLGVPARLLRSIQEQQKRTKDRESLQAAAAQAEVARASGEAAEQAGAAGQALAAAGGVPASPNPMVTPPLLGGAA